MRNEPKLNLGNPTINVTAAPVGGVKQTLIQKPTVDQTFGEIAGALKGLIPGLEDYYKVEQVTETEQAKSLAAGMTIQEAIAFAKVPVEAQSKILKSTGLRAHAAANAAVGKTIGASFEYTKETFDDLYNPLMSDTDRAKSLAKAQAGFNYQLQVLGANPLIAAAAKEQLNNYTRQVMSNASSVRKNRLDNIAIDETYNESHDKVRDALSGLEYGGASNDIVVRLIKTLDKTQRDNFAGIPGVNNAFDNGIKDAIVGYADQSPDQAQLVIESLVDKGFYSREEATSIQDKILSQQDVRQRRENQTENVKFDKLGNTADNIIFEALKGGIEPGTSVTEFLSSDKGAKMVEDLQKQAMDLGIPLDDGRLNALLRTTATGIFRDAGAGEYDITKEKEQFYRDLGANNVEFIKAINSEKFSPEQRARATQIFSQNTALFRSEIDKLEIEQELTPKFLNQADQRKYADAVNRGSLDEARVLLEEGQKSWKRPISAYDNIINDSIRDSSIEDIAFKGSNSLNSQLTEAAGEELSSINVTESDILKESERIIKQRLNSIKGWGNKTVEEKNASIIKALGDPIRMSETSYDDVIKARADLPIVVEDAGLGDITEETFKSSFDNLRTIGNSNIVAFDKIVSDGDLGVYLSDLDNNVNTPTEALDNFNVYQKVATTNNLPNEIKTALALPMVSAGTTIEELGSRTIYADPRLTTNKTFLHDPEQEAGKTGIYFSNILPTIEGTKLIDMSYARIKDDDYEQKLDGYLKMSADDAEQSDIGLLLFIVGPKDLPRDPQDRAVIDYIDYLKKANKVATARATKQTKKALYGGLEIND